MNPPFDTDPTHNRHGREEPTILATRDEQLCAGLLRDPDRISAVEALGVKPEHLSRPWSRVLRAVYDLSGGGHGATPISVSELIWRDESGDGSADDAVERLEIGASLSVQHVEDHARAILRRVEGDRIASVCNLARGRAMRGDPPTEVRAALLEDIERSSVRGVGAPKSAADAAREAMATKANPDPGIPTGFPDLDALAGGHQPEEYVVVGADTSVGKTSFCLGMADAAASAGVPVLYLSRELPAKKLIFRLLKGRFQPRRKQPDDEIINSPHGIELLDDLAKLPLHFDETASGLKLLRSSIRSGVRNLGVRLVVVDYLQRQGCREKREYDALSGGLKDLANDLGITVVAASQLSREAAKTADAKKNPGRPHRWHLKESGDIENDADKVILLYREEIYLRASGRDVPEEKRNVCEVIVDKNREGETGSVLLRWRPLASSFEHLHPVDHQGALWAN